MTINSPKTTKTGGNRHDRNRPSKTQHKINTEANPNAGGIDIGAAEIVVAVPPDRCAEHVRTFTSFTSGLIELRDWLLACGVTTVAMESTGVYWKPVYNLLEDRFTLLVVNAHHIKNVPGRKKMVI